MLRLLVWLAGKIIPWVLVAGAAVIIWNYIVSPKPSSSPRPVATVAAKPGVIDAIKNVNKQIFVEYYITKDIDYTEVPSNWTAKLGLKQQYVLLLKGRVPAGFDMSTVTESNIWVSNDGSAVQLTLPPPIIFEDEVSLDLENSRVLAQSDTCPDFLCNNASKTLLNQSLPEGKSLIITDAREGGILIQAARDGQLYYENLLRSLGYENVHVIVTGYTPN